MSGGCYEHAFAAAMKACEWNDSGNGDVDEENKIHSVLTKKREA